ncbi:hypothetical protein HGA88_02830 [Candidatus Roizmanbacteria bacterium]|nr:hypothetical protein [Candidatus Roizmanbacteria bacterium]
MNDQGFETVRGGEQLTQHFQDMSPKRIPRPTETGRLVPQFSTLIDSTIPFGDRKTVKFSPNRPVFSAIHQFNDAQSQEFMRGAAEVSPVVQILALLSNEHPLTHQPMQTVEEKIAFAKNFHMEQIPPEVQQRLNPRYQLTLEGYAGAFLEANETMTQCKEQGINIYEQFVKAKYNVTDRQFRTICAPEALRANDWAQNLSPEKIAFMKNPLFQEQEPNASNWTYKEGREVLLGNGKKYFVYAVNGNKMQLMDDMRNVYYVPKGYVDTYNKPNFADRLATVGNMIKKVGDYGKLGALMLFNLGEIHPWRVNGRWCLVAEPSARILDDPKQNKRIELYGNDENDYYYFKFKAMKEGGQRIVDLSEKNPSITSRGVFFQALDHRRIAAAQALKMPIVIQYKPDVDTYN